MNMTAGGGGGGGGGGLDPNYLKYIIGRIGSQACNFLCLDGLSLIIAYLDSILS